MRRRRLAAVCFVVWTVALTGCGSSRPPQPSFVPACAAVSSSALTQYDQMSASYLNEVTRHPPNNFGGAVSWGTRYYLESLITAYEATGNTKYAQAFLDSGTWVMNLVQTIPVINTPDPTAPGATGPILNVTGWPTLLNSFGTPVPVPTENGKVSLYAQSLSSGDVVASLQITKQGSGSLQLAWLGPSNQVLQSNSVAAIEDLEALAAQPLVWGQSLGRIILTGAGLPAVGQYPVNTDFERTVWHEQTGGILLPFAQFLLLAKKNPEIADSETVDQWTTKVLSIASGYEDEFVPDGMGGLLFHNPQWLPNFVADTDAAADYVFVEAQLRLVLYELASDPHQLALARGLLLHQQMYHWQSNSEGWLELKAWPCLIPWSTRANAPAGSIWDVYQFDPQSAAPSTDASFVADFLGTAAKYDMVSQLGIDPAALDAQQSAFMDYMAGGTSIPFAGPKGIIRASFPTDGATSSDPITYSPDPWAAAAWAPPGLSNQIFTNANWNWMLQYGQTTHDYNVGYFLRAWARSEAAQITVCSAQASPAKSN